MNIQTKPQESIEIRAALLKEMRSRLPAARNAVTTTYDVTSKCNLTCEGCFYFSRDNSLIKTDTRTIAPWEILMQKEAERGVNLAIVAGAEPSLRRDVLEVIGRHLPAGTIFTNGTVFIPKEIDYRLLISLWGGIDTTATTRGANVIEKAFANYAGDHRAIFMYTINSLNIHEIEPVVQLCQEKGVRLTFQFYSPTSTYLGNLDGKDGADLKYHRQKEGEISLQLDNEAQAQADIVLAHVMQAYPKTVLYSSAYHTWIRNPDRSPYDLDSKGFADNCASRLSSRYHYYTADAVQSHAKCGHSSIECKTCRALPGGAASYLRLQRPKPSKDLAADIASMRDWIEVFDFWHELFVGHQANAIAAN